MDRRAFLQTSGAASLAPFMLTSRKSTAQSSGLDPSLIQACSDSQAIALANVWAGTPAAQDWYGVINAHTSLRNAVLSGGFDPAFSGAVPDSVDPGAFDPGPTNQYMQNFAPGFNLSDYIGQVPTDPGSIAQACQGFQAGGLSGHCLSVIDRSRVMVNMLLHGGRGGGGGYALSSLPRPSQFSATPLAGGVAGPPKPELYAYDCAGDGAAILAVSTVFIVVGLMAGPFGVLAMGFWVGFSVWGGVGAGVWALGHATVCPF